MHSLARSFPIPVAFSRFQNEMSGRLRRSPEVSSLGATVAVSQRFRSFVRPSVVRRFSVKCSLKQGVLAYSEVLTSL